jgi:hypothetical protein
MIYALLMVCMHHGLSPTMVPLSLAIYPKLSQEILAIIFHYPNITQMVRDFRLTITYGYVMVCLKIGKPPKWSNILLGIIGIIIKYWDTGYPSLGIYI